VLARLSRIGTLQADAAKEAAIHALKTVVDQITSGATLPFTILAPTRSLFSTRQDIDWIEAPDPIAWVSKSRQAGDLLLFVGIDAVQEALGQVPALDGERFLVAQAAIERPSERREPVAGPVVTGRSVKPSHA
jgi:hypothetical protein